MAGKKIEVSAGIRFGRLTTTGDFKKIGKEVVWRCICDCGNEVYVRGYQVRQGGKGSSGTKSCGCLKRENASKRLSIIMQSSEIRAKSGLKRRKPDSAFREVLGRYKKAARRRGLEFRLTEDEFKTLTKSSCFYCGIEPHRIFETTNAVERYTYNGVDRRDSNLGYFWENCLPCCWLCNRLKMALDFNVFMQQILKIASVHAGSIQDR